jgi:hypothetical protein
MAQFGPGREAGDARRRRQIRRFLLVLGNRQAQVLPGGKGLGALKFRERFPVEVNRAPREALLRLADVARLTVSIVKIHPFLIAEDWRPAALAEKADLRTLVAPGASSSNYSPPERFRARNKGVLMADARIFQDLKADHDRHRDMLTELAAADFSDRGELFEALRIEISAHAAAEEESLYATMLANPELRDEARHSVSEHKEVDDYFGELVELDPESAAWTAKFEQMRHRYEHHIDEEEEDMFPAASEKLSREEEARLAEIFERRKPKEKARAEETGSGDERE